MNVLELFQSVTTFVFDVDGVLTDGTLLVMPNGLMARRMNIKDGYAMQLAIKKGYNVVIISGGNSPEVEERLNKLGVKDVYMRVEDKRTVLHNYMQLHDVSVNQLLFMGDDVPDLEVMHVVGMPCCPCDAVIEVKGISKYISPFKGGEGCVRDVIEKVMKLRNHWSIDTHIRAQ
ncbi:3-deoxy-D-manno-octulosonate 8-phosphate phosphatase [Panacibacter sp. DH6]|uniref:3-deoxy-D-manno-octulosonate 8-phosphate phosphatase n=1 Tax=Panacibacter microcysteis TaxID=2793269 RepID=A0A931GX76_9BACT|nr:3-deoxy-D-manno-octulosonate 8-phosphate phosphatase [Panacibacter microcysteis]MBG9377518.1 3-deoxy-D-manno-octulosonate 8-phosphate phosphatase [Panacibacter microcysteis]